MGIIQAFKRAFNPGEGPALVIKSINGERRIPHLERVRSAAGPHPDIIVSDGYLSPIEKNSMMARCDCYVSLHRSEGYGLTMAEAMALGKPVIATGYSGNLEFMTPENSYLCACQYREIGGGADPYPPTSRWAEPDIDEAARFMREVYSNQEEAVARGVRAASDIAALHSPFVAGGAISDRIAAIRARRARFGRTAPVEIFEHRLEVLESARRTVVRTSTEEQVRLAQLDEMTSKLDTMIREWVERFNQQQVKFQTQQTTLKSQQETIQNSVEKLVNEITEALDRSPKQMDEQSQRLRTIESELGRLQEIIPSLQFEAARLPLLDVALKALSLRLGQISSHIEAVPYMTDPGMLRTKTATGGQTIGYRGGRQNGLDKDMYIGFENIFRGSEQMIRDRQRNYLDLLRECNPVVDLGCGRGEMLDLLKEIGISATGVDVDAGMVTRASSKGHQVVQQDAVRYLAAQPNESIGAIFCAQMIEHMPYEELLKLLKLSLVKLKTNGVLIAETVNPHSFRAFRTFWVDPTHNKPLFPEVMVALCKQVGYAEATIRFPCGSGDFDHDRLSEGEYAVIASKALSSDGAQRKRNGRRRKPAKSSASVT